MAGRVLQGRFRAGGFAAAQAAVRARAIQPQVRGHAQQLPDGVLGRSSGGRPLPDPVRTQMESFFGTDFGDVRIHVGQEAPAIGALAFTLGSNLYFAPGQLNLDSTHGRALLGHELTHVVQQRAGRVRNPFGSGVAVVQDPALEAEADRMGWQAAVHRAAATVQQKPAHPSAAPRAPAQPKARPATAEGGFGLLVGAYLHQDRKAGLLPDGLAGHGFVAVEMPGGRREAWGFSPQNYDTMDPRRDLPRLTSGVPGRVHRDDGALSKPGVRVRTIPISGEQARAALAKIGEYRSTNPQFSLARRQCSSFAADVAKAAGVDGFGGGTVKPPREFYRKI